eukprot:COSAG01_NODE_135_length_24448_cov_154.590086_4_plen_40_part_00
MAWRAGIGIGLEGLGLSRYAAARLAWWPASGRSVVEWWF